MMAWEWFWYYATRIALAIAILAVPLVVVVGLTGASAGPVLRVCLQAAWFFALGVGVIATLRLVLSQPMWSDPSSWNPRLTLPPRPESE